MVILNGKMSDAKVLTFLSLQHTCVTNYHLQKNG